jgi:hypothetical protein
VQVNAFVLVFLASSCGFSPEQAQTIGVLDKLLSSPGAGSFLRHAIILLNRSDAETYKLKEKKVKDLVEEMKKQLVKGGLEELVEGSMQREYNDPTLWDDLEQRAVLVPSLFVPDWTKPRMLEALKKTLDVMKGLGPFDCSGVSEAERKELQDTFEEVGLV